MPKCRTCGVRFRGGNYFCAEHSPVKDPEWRKRHASQAGKAGARAKRRRLQERLGAVDNVTAYRKGYKRGYEMAWHKWQAWGREVLKRRTPAA